jgi:hypothetical protein
MKTTNLTAHPPRGGLFLMTKDIGYYVSHLPPRLLASLDRLMPEEKLNLAYCLLTLSRETEVSPAGIECWSYIHHIIEDPGDHLSNMDRLEYILVSAGLLTVAHDQMKAVEVNAAPVATLDDFLDLEPIDR